MNDRCMPSLETVMAIVSVRRAGKTRLAAETRILSSIVVRVHRSICVVVGYVKSLFSLNVVRMAIVIN